jgi:LDH2 family malate/lactate/ureidoglycolate dehydrogenase
MCLEHDMIGFSTTNNSGTAIVPTFGIEPMLSTNPFSIAAPAGTEPPFELDMATSVAAHTKVFVYRSKGLKIPLGWALGKDGRPTDNPQEAIDSGLLAPLGSTPELSSYKGYGLALAVDIITGVLGGGMYGTLAKRLEAEDGGKRKVTSCHMFAAMRIDCFQDVDRFKADMDDMLRALKESKKAEGYDRIYTAGEMEHETELVRLREGIPLRADQVEELRQLSAETGIPCTFLEAQT